MLSKSEKNNILLSVFAFSSTIDKDEKVTFDGLLEFASEASSLEVSRDMEDLVLDYMSFSGEEQSTLDALSDETLSEHLTAFSKTFDSQDEVFSVIDSFIENYETTSDKVCDARHKKHLEYNADGSRTLKCKLKKGAVKKKRTMKQKMADARRKGKKLSKLTRMKISKGKKNRAKGH